MVASAEYRSTIDPTEVARFAVLSRQWWDERGPFRALHQINPARLSFICDRARRHFGGTALRFLEGKRALDIGCGGGLISEPLARLGASVVAIDAGQENIQAAMVHGRPQNLGIEYRAAAAEDLARAGESFDLIVALEVIEHVGDREAFLDACGALLRPGGLIVFGTLSRTLRSLLLAVVGGEYLLGWIPRGTHDWRRFIGLDELIGRVKARGLVPEAAAGIRYAPLDGGWRLSHDTSVNYMLSAIRPSD